MLTKEQILALPAGRKLDELVHYFVMDKRPDTSAPAYRWEVPSYSIDLNDAFKIMDGVNFFTTTMSLSSRGGPDYWIIKTFQGKWVVVFKTPGEPTIGYIEGEPAETLALAICRTAVIETIRREYGAAKAATYELNIIEGSTEGF